MDSLHGAWGQFLGETGPPHRSPPRRVRAWHRPGDGRQRLIQHGPEGSWPSTRFKEFLRNTGREELRPERLEQEVKTLVWIPGRAFPSCGSISRS